MAGSGGIGGDTGLPGGIYPIDGTGAELPTDDLEPFGTLVGDAPLVGLGESVHTSGGYLELKARLIRYLMSERGFRVLAMETPRTQAKMVQAYVASCQGTPEDALQGIFGVFASTATRDLVAWMCAYNQQHSDDPLSFVGFDAQQPWDDLPELSAFLTAAAPSDQAALDQGLVQCDGHGYASANDYYGSGGFDAPYTAEAFQACTAGIDALDGYFDAHAVELEAASSSEALAWARVASTSLRSWQGEKYYSASDVGASYEARDVAMASILEHSRELLFPDAKAVVFAHNYHLTQAHTEVDEPQIGPVQTMGTVLATDFGEDYRAYALIGYDVEINWPGVGYGPTGTPVPGSIEALMHGLGRPYLFADFVAPEIASFITPGASYSFGHPGPASLVPARQFHGAFYLELSPPMDALFW